jgi:hypothetical protein
MSVGSVQSNAWLPPWEQSASSAQSGASGTSFNSALPAAGTQAASGQGAASNPFQSLANDIQAMLIQVQSTAGAGAQPVAATGTSATTPSTSSSPEQQVATDLQSIMSEMQGVGSTTTQSATADPASATGQTQHHHHHHHEGGGGEASGASEFASGSASSTAGSSSTGSGDQALSQMISSDIEQALQAYGGTTTAGPTSLLTV